MGACANLRVCGAWPQPYDSQVGRVRIPLLIAVALAMGCNELNPEFDGREGETGETTAPGDGDGDGDGDGETDSSTSDTDTGGDGSDACDPDAPDLALCFDFEVQGEGVFVDHSAHGNHADLSNTQITPGPWGNAFDVTAQAKAAVPDSASLDIDGPITIEGWLNLRSLPASQDGARQGIVDNEGQYAVFIYGPDELRCQLGFDDVSITVEQLDEWFHFACVYDGDEMRAYLNAVEVDSLGGSGAIPTEDTSPMTIGNAAVTYDAPLDGLMDNFRIWSAGLGDARVCSVSGVAGC